MAGISLDLAPGACLLVVGPSGSGKSTLARALAGLVPWAVTGRLDGRVEIDGLEVGRADHADLVARVGVVFQDPSSQLVMERAADDVAFGLEGRRWPRDAMLRRVPEALAEAGLAGFERRRTARLSGGEQQRLALAGALAPRPGLLVLDEPTANLDPAGAVAFAGRLAVVRAARAATIVLVEHRADLAWSLADVVLALGPDGAPLALGAPAELLAGRRADLDAAGIWLPDEPQSELPPAAPAAAAPGADGVPAAPAAAAPGAIVHAGAKIAAGSTLAGHPLVRARQLGFGWDRDSPVLGGVDLDVAEGERVALLGPNGSGKSTLLRLLVGLLRPTAGSVRLAGRDPARLRPHDLARLAGYVTQDPERGFVDGTVEGELTAGLDPTERAAVGDVAAALDLPLDRFGARNPHALSGGEQRRLSVAAQLVRRPRLLALDEPTYGQDRRTYDALVGLLRERIGAGTALVAATHDLRFVADVGGRAVHLAGGRLVPESAVAGGPQGGDPVAPMATDPAGPEARS